MKAGDGKMGWNMGKAETENPGDGEEGLGLSRGLSTEDANLRHISVSEERGREA